ncbi:MAG: helix-turn-helix domain-containing protein [Alistipes sp.]|nr:helix-turn-helix domain-containing protein [Alistipes sp.]
MDDFIGKFSPIYMDIIERIEKAEASLLNIESNLPHHIAGEIYLTAEQVMNRYHISPRALQNYRDNNVLPYTILVGKILYPLSLIENVLEKNYHGPR